MPCRVQAQAIPDSRNQHRLAKNKEQDEAVREPHGFENRKLAHSFANRDRMVLPVTSNSVKNTTPPMETIRNSMFPNCFAKSEASAFSVSVLDS